MKSIFKKEAKTRRQNKIIEMLSKPAQKAMKLRFNPTTLFQLSLGDKFNIYLFSNKKRKAFQVDGQTVTDLIYDYQLANKKATRETIINHLFDYVKNMTGFSNLFLLDYKYGLFFTTEDIILKEFNMTGEEFQEQPPVLLHQKIGELLNIPCTIKDWDLKNNNQIFIHLNNSSIVKVFMCTDKDISKIMSVVSEEIHMYREMAEEYNKLSPSPLEKIYQVNLSMKLPTEEGGRFAFETRKQLERRQLDKLEDYNESE